jgi:O-antigen ligase
MARRASLDGPGMNRRQSPSLFGMLLVAVIAWGALAFGAVYPWAYVPLALVSAGLGTWAILVTRAWQDPRATQLAVAMALVAAAIGVQLIALPYGVLARLSPGVDRFLRQLTVAYHPASLHPLSISPGSTVVALVLFVALGLLLIGTMRAMRMVRLEWLVLQLMGLGLGLVVFGVVQQAFIDVDAPLLYGFWQPSYGAAPYGPFINRNHFAGWMVMVIPVVAGYAYALYLKTPSAERSGRGTWIRWVATVEANRFLLVTTVGLLMCLSVVLTGSRSGLASLLVAFAVVGFLGWRATSSARRRLLAVTYLGVLLLGALAWGGADTLIARFGDAPGELEGRFSAWRDAGRIMRDFPVFGTGLGTFAQAMLLYQSGTRTSMYAQAHNDYIQLAAEGGLLVVVPVLALLITIVKGIRRRFSSGQDDPLTASIRTGAVAGLVGIAAQSLVEFSLQMPGNAVLCAVMLAVALHRPARMNHAHRV